MRKIVIVWVAIIAFWGCSNASNNIKIKEIQYQYPVLKNKPINPILFVNVKVKDSTQNLTLRELNIENHNFKVVANASVNYIGADSLWSWKTKSVKFSTVNDIKRETMFSGFQELQKGNNYFVLSYELKNNASLTEKIDASCISVKFNNGSSVADIERESGSIKQRVGVAVRKHKDDGVHTYRIPGLTTTNNGTLLAVYDVRRDSGRDLQGDIDIGLSRSIDGGNSWEPMRIVLDMKEWGNLPQKYNGVSDACILVDKNSGHIYVAGLWMYGVINKDGKWLEGLNEESTQWNHQWRNRGSQPGFSPKETSQFLISKSVDDGKTWSKPVNITKMCKKKEWWLWAPAPGHGITLTDGTLVFPTQGRDKTGLPFSNITYSKDGGKTWITSNAAYRNTTESMAAELTDGSIMLNMRDNRNRKNKGATNGRAICVTKDMGETWTEHPTSHGVLNEPVCMASIHKHIYKDKNGKMCSVLLFSNPNTKNGRYNMTIKVSFDDGKTWPKKNWMLLDAGWSAGYSCLTSVDEKTIGILYEGSQAHMTFEAIPLRELIGE